MPQQTKFNVGDLVKYNEWDGYIVFTCTNYIVVCIRQWEDKEALHGVGQVNILVYPHEWDDMYIEAEHFYNHKSYKGVIRDHPGNEDLPSDITGK